MKERPILFNAEMVNAILSGRKTQTRRIMKDQPELISPEDECGSPGYWIPWNAVRSMVRNDMMKFACPFGIEGDRLWVRETCQAKELQSGLDVVFYLADSTEIPIPAHPLDSGRWVDLYRHRRGKGKIVPSIHMPRWASRISLEITGVRVERLHDITLGDICKEIGCGLYDFRPATHGFQVWEDLWQSIYGAESWQANPWVWVIEFKRVDREVKG